MKRSALIIIDVQLGMYNGERITPIFQGEEKIERISKLIERAREKKLIVIYVRHVGGEGHPLELDTKGFDIHPKVSPDKEDIIIEKNTPDSFLDTTLSDLIKAKSIANIYVVGNQTDFCIDTTCRRAWAKGLNVLLAGNCHSTWDTDNLSADQIIDHHNGVLGNGFVTVKNSTKITFEEFEES